MNWEKWASERRKDLRILGFKSGLYDPSFSSSYHLLIQLIPFITDANILIMIFQLWLFLEVNLDYILFFF
jgi:hypothetical protein